MAMGLPEKRIVCDAKGARIPLISLAGIASLAL